MSNIYTYNQWGADHTFKAERGQEIESIIYFHMMECLPPLNLPLAGVYPVTVTSGFMVSEPYTHVVVDGRCRAFYNAYGRCGDHYYYLGHYSRCGHCLEELE